jgi:Cu/Ag efflux pump CusA
MLVSMTVTPVLCYYLLPRMRRLEHGDSALVAWLKRWDARLLAWSFPRSRGLVAGAIVAVLAATASVPFFPRAFLPAFNEGSLVLSLLLNPGTSLAEANRLGSIAEALIREVPEVTQVGRRTGRAELDEHAEGVHSAEIDVDLQRSGRGREAVMADIRQKLAVLPRSASRSRTGSTTCSPACARRSRSRSTATTPTRCGASPSRCAPSSRASRG